LLTEAIGSMLRSHVFYFVVFFHFYVSFATSTFRILFVAAAAQPPVPVNGRQLALLPLPSPMYSVFAMIALPFRRYCYKGVIHRGGLWRGWLK